MEKRKETLKKYLFLFQLLEYDPVQFRKWLQEHPQKEIKEEKKRLVWTPKARFIFFLAFPFYLLLRKPGQSLTLAQQIIKPPELLIKLLIIALAKIKMRTRKDLIVIGVTGSFGKTSIKEITYQILSQQFQVLKTPKSYNTPLGTGSIILRQLKKEHQIFIVEMGAYKKGEIENICKLVEPKIGILTGINPQHLERFGTLERTIKAKSELIESLPKEGLAIFNFDNIYSQKIGKEINLNKIFYSISASEEKLKKEKILLANNVKLTSEFKTFFRLKCINTLKQEGVKLETSLLGKHNVGNILAATAVASYLGVEFKQISQAIEKLKPIPHRLQLLDPGAGILILDDTYSANPDGFRQALEVLSQFENRRKILVTPGIVELGPAEIQIHQELGQMAGKVCNFIILVTESIRTNALRKGILETSFKKENLHTVKDLNEAQDLLRNLGRPLDIILLENDLPDQYL